VSRAKKTWRMATDRLVDIFALLARYEKGGASEGSLCLVAAEITELSGAGIALSSDSNLMTSMGTTTGPATELMDIEITLREGPCTDACRGEDAVEDIDLLRGSTPRWVVYTPQAIAVGARAVFGFPVRIGAVRLGALSLYRDKRGALTYEQASDGYLMASVIGRAILAMQAGASGNALATELEREATFDFAIHQAAGILAIQGFTDVGSALVLLRTHAFATNTPISTLATRVIAHQTSYDSKSAMWSEETS
jgi:hypothetical protein